MATLDEILDGNPGLSAVPRRTPAQEEADYYASRNASADIDTERLVIEAPRQLLDQWLGEPEDVVFLLRLIEDKLFECQRSFSHHVVTAELLEGDLPSVMEKLWEEVLEKEWATGEMPPFRFVQNRIDPCIINFEWVGPLVTINLPS